MCLTVYCFVLSNNLSAGYSFKFHKIRGWVSKSDLARDSSRFWRPNYFDKPNQAIFGTNTSSGQCCKDTSIYPKLNSLCQRKVKNNDAFTVPFDLYKHSMILFLMKRYNYASIYGFNVTWKFYFICYYVFLTCIFTCTR